MNKNGPSQQKKRTDVPISEINPVVRLHPDIKAKIGQQLRLLYSEVVDQGVPERFVEMLKQLDDPTDEGSKK